MGRLKEIHDAGIHRSAERWCPHHAAHRGSLNVPALPAGSRVERNALTPLRGRHDRREREARGAARDTELSERQIERIRDLARDFKQVWNAAQTGLKLTDAASKPAPVRLGLNYYRLSQLYIQTTRETTCPNRLNLQYLASFSTLLLVCAPSN